MSGYFVVSGVSFAILASSRLGRALGAALETRLHLDILSVPVLYSLGALCLSFGVMTSPGARAFLGSRLPQFFGRISFSLYLLHMPILYTGFTALFIAFGHPRAEITLVLWALGFVVTAVAAAMVMTRLIDEPLMRWLKSKRHRAEAT
jgi:peptidoglycan/LPS O-acetylase OafA/YrhL